MKENIVYLAIGDLHPYKNNPRDNAGAVDAVVASIKEFGFRSPIIINADHEIINGHTRWKAAKKLGMEEVPCLIVTDLTPEQIKQYRLIDNKTSEYAKWDADMLANELSELTFDLDFDFDFGDDTKKRKSWEKEKIRCDLKDKLGLKRCNDAVYHSLFRTGKAGILLEDLKCPDNVRMFAKTAEEFVLSALGPNLRGDWCILTTPRRRHKEGFHFSTEICRWMGDDLQIPFYEDAFEAENRDRMNPIFNMRKDPKEKNVIVYDDILTTGYTLQTVRTMLIDEGHTTFPLISIDNH